MSVRFFIDRPILSGVLSIVIFLLGLVSIVLLPIEQLPNVLPPQINVQASYPGASAETVAQAIASPIEHEVNGVENMIYMYSNCSATGDYTLNVLFKVGADIKQALIDVQNKVELATPLLPEEVQRSGVNVFKQTPSILLVLAMQSPSQQYDEIFLSNYASVNVVEELQRIPGVSSVRIINDRTYAMRVWLDPVLLRKYELTPRDVADAIKDQNNQYSIGRIGETPTSGHTEMTISITNKGRLSTPEEFNNIIVKAGNDGSLILLKDIGGADLGAQSYNVACKLNGIPTISIAVYQQFGANALQVAQSCKDKLEEIAKRFPQGIEYGVPYDTTKFVKVSIQEVLRTIAEAAVLVVLVVYIFLQNFRLTLIPLLAMIISIVGAFAGIYAMGLSINILTLFALVLAIGIVVDDAIVVIENVERNMRVHGYSAKEAAYIAMDEVQGPLVAIVLVLCSVFIPVAFLGGIAGQLYKQFAITICISVIISGIVALTLSPALSACLLTKHNNETWFHRAFNSFFDRLTQLYGKGSYWITHHPKIGVSFFVSLCLFLAYLFNHVPQGFVPNEDQGYLISVVNMPESTSLERTEQTTLKTESLVRKEPAVDLFFGMSGFSFLDGLNRTNQGTNFIVLKDWSLRQNAQQSAPFVLRDLYKMTYNIPEGQVFFFNPPSIQGLGTVSGFEFWLENRGGGGYEDLELITRQFIEKVKRRPELSNITSTISSNAPQLYLNVDYAKAKTLGVATSDIFDALHSLLGSLYVNNFNKDGRVYRVVLMARPQSREDLIDIKNIYVRSRTDKLIPLESFVSISPSSGPNLISRFNNFAAAKITGSAAPGVSSGKALEIMESLAKEELPQDVSFSWSGESYQEKEVQGSSISMMLGGLLMVFLILAALYERWSAPLAVILAVPFGIAGSFTAIWFAQMSNDIYFQIGLITIIALSAKNAILIVEFAMSKIKEGMSHIDAALEAGKLRFRAIMMTSLTFILGVLPLVLSTGPGANSRRSVGVGVLGGMCVATFMAIFFVPLFFRLIMDFMAKKETGELSPISGDKN